MGSLFTTGAGSLYPPSGGSGSGTSVKVARFSRNSGDYVIGANAGVWSEVDSAARLSVAAAAGDKVLFGFAAMKTINNLFVDIAAMNAGSPVRYASSETATPCVEGLPSFYPTSFWSSGGNYLWVVQAGDLTAGSLIAGLFVNPAQGGTLYADANYPFRWWALNLGAGT